MLFSVLVPVYNTSKYLRQCIESVLVQTEKDYELILLDDGSTDDSGIICDEYADKYTFIRVIHKENEGLLMTRRRGFIEAKGEFCICLDSDDCLLTNKAFSKIRVMIEEKHCDMVIYDYIMGQEKKENGRIITVFDYPPGFVFEEKNKRFLYDKLLVGKFLNPLWIKVVARKIIDVGVDYSIWKDEIVRSQGEDIFQSFPILNAAQRVGYLKEPLYFYRWNNASISRNLRLEYYYSYRAIYRRADEYIKLWKIDPETQEQHRQKRIGIVMGILVTGLRERECSESMRFIDMLSKDSFFRNIMNVKVKKSILPYYRILAFLIRNNMQHVTIWTIDIVSAISNMKHRKRSRK